MNDAEVRYRVRSLMDRAKRMETTFASVSRQMAEMADAAERLVMDMQPSSRPLPGQGADVESDHVNG